MRRRHRDARDTQLLLAGFTFGAIITLLLTLLTLSSSSRHPRSTSSASLLPIDARLAQPLRPPPVTNRPTHSLNLSRCKQITYGNLQFAYVPSAKLLFIAMSKAGTTTLWQWLYVGLTGQQSWNASICGLVHNRASTCWENKIVSLYQLHPNVRQEVLVSPDILRVALQRDPYQRLVSAFKSKYACDHFGFLVDRAERHHYVSFLRKFARTVPDSSLPLCMNLSEFAHALTAVRHNIRTGRFRITSSSSKTKTNNNGNATQKLTLRYMERHVRPQQFFFDDVEYQMIIDVAHLNDPNVMRPIANRLPYGELLSHRVLHEHPSGHGNHELHISLHDEALLRSYADESVVGRWKFLPGYYPSK